MKSVLYIPTICELSNHKILKFFYNVRFSWESYKQTQSSAMLYRVHWNTVTTNQSKVFTYPGSSSLGLRRIGSSLEFL